MAHSNDEVVRRKLRERGVAERVVVAGAEGLISRWAEFAAAVESGYRFGLADYRNDLDIRTLIAVAGLEHEPAVRDSDDKLRRVLAGSHTGLWSSDVPDAFWVRGIPCNASGELLADLKSEGFV